MHRYCIRRGIQAHTTEGDHHVDPSDSPRSRDLTAGIAALALLVGIVSHVAAADYGSWSLAVSAESAPGTSSELNTPSNDGCPIESPDGLRIYTATNRPGGLGGIDIWMAQRPSTDSPFGAPVNLGRAHQQQRRRLLSHAGARQGSLRSSALASVAGACGGADIYFARDNPAHGWSAPANLGCQVNSALGEAGPSYFEAGGSAQLYFSSGPDIYRSVVQANGSFGTAMAVTELNTAASECRPKSGRMGWRSSSTPTGRTPLADRTSTSRPATA